MKSAPLSLALREAGVDEIVLQTARRDDLLRCREARHRSSSMKTADIDLEILRATTLRLRSLARLRITAGVRDLA